jgi:hypothetical protein
MGIVKDRGKPVYAPDSDEAPGSREVLLSGSFSVVRYTHDDGASEAQLVLMGREPENRKLVYRISEEIPFGVTTYYEDGSIHVAPVQNMEGGSRGD